jgi:hypothetical protein
MKIRTLSELQDKLDRDSSWRVKEIADMKSAVRQELSIARKTLIRAGVPLLYAHWEGFVKVSATAYIIYVGSNRLTFDQLAGPFVTLGARSLFSKVSATGSMQARLEVAEFFLKGQTGRANFSASNLVETKSNLNSNVLEEILCSVGISTKHYQTKYNLIDESLLSRRNQIAHGEFCELDAVSFRLLADEVIDLMKQFKHDIETNASAGSFRR